MPTGIPKNGINSSWFKIGHAPTSGVFKKGHQIRNSGKTRFKQGNIPPFKGKHLPEEVKKKLSKSLKGKKPPKTAYKVGDVRITGERNNHWKGGITPENIKIRQSLRYKKWRTTVYIRDNFTCQVCNVVGGELQAHHIKSFSSYPKLRFDVSNGITLCKKCHKLTDNYLVKARYLTKI